MAKIGHALARFARDELSIHRLYVHEPTFRSICDDYDEAVAAIQRWEPQDKAKADELRKLALELEAEIEAYITRSSGTKRPLN